MSIKSVKEQFDKIAPDLKIIEFDEPTATVSYTHLTLPTICSV